MKLFPKGAWGYAVLLVLLFSIAAIATWQVIDFITDRFLLSEHENIIRGFSLSIWLLTMGLMFLAGALGLLAISATAEYESRHRISKIVNKMNYLSDGLLALDYQGHVRGANPAMRKLASIHFTVGKRSAINDIFPSLSAEDIKRLLNRNSPSEVESEYFHSSGLRILRLRSQPVEGLILMLVSDITEAHAAEVRQQQAAKFQLLGRIAGGVAHDFSNILSAISGHAVLMQRFGDDKRALDNSIGVIASETQRGVRLSRQLLGLSRSSESDGQLSSNFVENIHEAEELLRVALSAGWSVTTEVNGVFPIVPLSPARIVQIILNLGLIAADALKNPGKLLIQVKQPDSPGLSCVSRGQSKTMTSQDSGSFAAIITILASAETGPASADLPGEVLPVREVGTKADSGDSGGGHGELQREPGVPAGMGVIDTTGVIPSVVRTLIEEAGGRLDELYVSNIKSIYRICLPYASQISRSDLTPLKSVVKGSLRLKQWRILLAFSDARFAWLARTLTDLGAVVEKKTAIDKVLGAIDSERKPDVIIVDKTILDDDVGGLLKAMRKISPNSGVIVISHGPEEKTLQREQGFMVIDPDSGEDVWLDAIIRSRSFAV